jgi:hypothetical protein
MGDVSNYRWTELTCGQWFNKGVPCCPTLNKNKSSDGFVINRAKPERNGVIYRAVGALVLHQGQLTGTPLGYRLPVPCKLCDVVHPSRPGCHTKESTVVRILPLPVPRCLPHHRTRLHFARYIGIVLFIACRPVGGIGIIVAALVCCNLLYNEARLVGKLQMAILTNMMKP